MPRWLYPSFALQQTYKRIDPKTNKEEPVRLDTIALDLGLVGPAAGGEFVQNNFHRLIGVPTANGWANQLHNEPTIGLTFERRWRTGHSVLLEDPEARIRLRAASGRHARQRHDLCQRRRHRCASARSCATTSARRARGRRCRDRKASSARGSAGISSSGRRRGRRAQHVPRRQLDGNSLRVTHRPFVGEAQAGLAILFRGVRISYTQVLRTPEFFERDRWDQFGSINVTFRY